MSPEEFKKRMSYLTDPDDEERAHKEMDGLMCELLISLGYQEGVEVFKNQRKWYA